MRKVEKLLYVIVAMIFLVSGCSTPVKVADVTGGWDTGTQNFYANLVVDEGYVIEEVWVNYSRHYWPELADSRRIEAEKVETGPHAGEWRVKVADALTFWKADSLFHVWGVRYRKQDGSEVRTNYSVLDIQNPHRHVVGCSDASINATLNQVFQEMNVLRQQSNQSIHGSYSLSPAHLGPVSLAGQGVPYSHTATVVVTALGVNDERYNNIGPSVPALLLYSPESESVAEITDGDPDEPYDLIGAAYGAVQTDAKRRPRLGCIPSENWFIHEAGYHLRDGGFHLTSPNESFPGEVVIASDGGLFPPPNIDGNPSYMPEPAPEVDDPISFRPTVWHPRLWDLHFWFSEETDTGVVMEINFPSGQPGLEVPSEAFFYSETFQ